MPMLTKKLPKHWRIDASQSGLYEVSVDEKVNYLGKSAVLIESETASYANRLFLEQVIDGTSWYGKRMRFACSVKTENVDAYATIAVSIQEPHGNIVIYDPMIDRALKDNNDWTELFIVVDVPPDGRWISFGPALWGKGKLWAAQFTVEEVSKDVPRTDDHGGTNPLEKQPVNLDFREYSDEGVAKNRQPVVVGWKCPEKSDEQKYSVAENVFNGANAAVIELVPSEANPSQPYDPYDERTNLGYFCQTFSAKPFRGSRIKFSSFIKTENVVGSAYLVLMINSVYTRLALSTMNIEGADGNNDWAEYSRVLDVSEFAYSISIWLQMNGSGKSYFSKIRVEAVSQDVPTTDKNHHPRNLDFSE
jgi:hypothetical protein